MSYLKQDNEGKYLDHFGFRCNPFPVIPDAESFYMCENVDHIVAELVHGVTTRKGFMILTGDVGLGKTTVSRKIMNILEEMDVETSLVFHTFYQESALLKEINQDFGLQVGSLDLREQMRALNDFLLAKNEEGKNCAIIVDDAQNLNHESLELIRMISNLETEREKLVQILLIGQPELERKLSSFELRQLRSRIMIHKKARPLTDEELEGYIMFKLYMAGSEGRLAVRGNALRRIWKFTKGNFRQVNILMERCLYVAFLYGTSEISKKIVKEAYKDLHPKISKSPRKKRLAFGLVATAALYLLGGYIFPGFPLKIPFSKSTTPVEHWPPDKDTTSKGLLAEITLGARQRERRNTGTEACFAEEVEIKSHTRDAIFGFLKVYNLEDFTPAFLKALKTNQLTEIGSKIFDKTGYQMISLDRVPGRVRRSYGMLGLSSGMGSKEKYLLFWKPEVNISKFYLTYEGDEIRKLEELLASANLYHYKLDGIVGPKVMRAVNQFQRKNGLTVTGFPTRETIFLLCHSGEEKT